MITRMVLLVLSLTAMLSSAVVLDRIAVVVGKYVIKTSDIERDMRITEFLNHEALNVSPQARRAAAERLIDQQLIRTELATGGYPRASDADAQAFLSQIMKQRFRGSETVLRSELARYGLTEDQLRAQLLWQLTVLKFIQQRFQAGVAPTDQEVRAYYDQHLAELKREHPRDSSFQALEPQVRSLVEGEQANRDLDEWLVRARQRTQIEYRQGAFQ